MLEHVIGNPLAKLDALNFVETPVDAEVDAALTIFLGRLAETRIGACDDGAGHAILVFSNAVEFVGRERKMDGVGAVEVGQGAERGRPKAGMA